MDIAKARLKFEGYLADQEKAIGVPLAAIEAATERISGGWVFYFNSRQWIENPDHSTMAGLLVGHGPVVMLDSGEILAGGSLDHDPNKLVAQYLAKAGQN